MAKTTMANAATCTTRRNVLIFDCPLLWLRRVVANSVDLLNHPLVSIRSGVEELRPCQQTLVLIHDVRAEEIGKAFSQKTPIRLRLEPQGMCQFVASDLSRASE